MKKEQKNLENSLAGVSPNKKFSFKEKLNKSLKYLGGTVLLGTIMGISNYYKTHSDLEIIANQNETIYRHSDEKTTHYLNIFADKEKFNEGDLLNIYRKRFEYGIKGKGIEFENIKEMSIDELDESAVSLARYYGNSTLKRGDFKKSFYKELEQINQKTHQDTTKELNKDIYKIVWQLEEECGNPRIRFVEDDIYFTPFSNFIGSAHYDPLKNIIYINYQDFTFGADNLFSELAHAKQFNKDQIGSYFQVVSTCIQLIKESKGNIGKIPKEYSKLYSKPGSIEYEAHRVIEPYLENKYNFYIKKSKEINKASKVKK